MTDYISRDEAIAETLKDPVGRVLAESNNLIGFLEGLPAADVVEVVRCKDCKYYTHMWYCEAWNNSPGFPAVSDDMFCSLAERRET